MRTAKSLLVALALVVLVSGCTAPFERDASAPPSSSVPPSPLPSTTVAPSTTTTAAFVPLAQPHVQVIYARPTDRPYNPKYAKVVSAAMVSVQSWFKRELGGSTYVINTPEPLKCELPHDSAYYLDGTWLKVYEDVQACAPVTDRSSKTAWVLYVDVLDKPCSDPWRLGAAYPGLAMLARSDLQGLAGETAIDGCGGKYDQPHGRWVGGLAHEMGHTFGLQHSPGCEPMTDKCDFSLVMWSGYSGFPKTYLSAADKAALKDSPFLKPR